MQALDTFEYTDNYIDKYIVIRLNAHGTAFLAHAFLCCQAVHENTIKKRDPVK